VRSRQLFAAGVSVALLLGAASPAFAKPGNEPKDPKPPKAPKTHPGRVNGGGVTQGGATFSVEAQQDRLSKGHFNYESPDGALKVRCDGFDAYHPIVYVTAGPPAARLTAQCVAKGPHHAGTPISLDATFRDNRTDDRTAATAKPDEADITLTRPDGTSVTDSGALRKGNVRVR
jgi:hypothetical protein